MAVDLVRFPPEYARGFTARYNFANTVVRLPGGRGREVVRNRELPMRSWVANKGLFKSMRADEFIGFARARHGAFYGWMFPDLTEFSTNPTNPKGAWNMTDQLLGEADGVKTRFPIRRSYNSVPDELIQRIGLDDRMVPMQSITDARLAAKFGLTAATVLNSKVALDGVDAGAFSFDLIKREFVFAAPLAAGVVTWGGYYLWPCAFTDETDRNLERIAESWTSDTVPSIEFELLEHDRFIPENDDPGGCETVTWSAGAPLISKAVRKHWMLNPTVGSLTVQVDDPATVYSAGGPHLYLYNISAFTIAVKDTLTGATMFTLGAAGSSSCVAEMIVRDNGSTVEWFATLYG